jgi:hypothetical protein
MRTRLAALFISILTVLGFSLATRPAQAATVHNCPQGYICLYDPTNYGYLGAGQMNILPQQIYLATNDCYNFTSNFINVTSSLVINYASPNVHDLAYFYPNNNCVGHPAIGYALYGLTQDPDLRLSPAGNVSNIWNSVKYVVD